MSTAASSIYTNASTPDPVKARHKSTWEDGNYARFARFMETGAIEVLESWDIYRATSLLDVGCGSGQTSIPAAKHGIKVTGVDIAQNLILHARKRALDAKLSAQFDVGDAENLPYANNNFDVVISMFGAMFAPHPEDVVAEFARVLPSGGQLRMANWTPSSMPAQMFKCVSDIVPPPANFIPPVLWGDEATVLERLSDNFTDIRLTRKIYPQWHYPFSTTELVDLFRTYFGPVKRAFDVADHTQQKTLHDNLEDIYKTNSVMHNDVLTITGGEYLDVVATRC